MKHFARKSWAIIILVVLATGIMGSMIPKIIIDNDIKGYLPHDLPSYKLLEDSVDVYGSEILMDVALTTTGRTILTPEYIETIQQMTGELENLKHVDDIQSLTNIDYITSMDGGMSARSLVSDTFGGTDVELQQLKQRIVDWQEMYDKIIISKDFRGSQIIMTIDKDITPAQMDTLYAETDRIVKNHTSGDLTIRLAGDPVLSQMARDYMYTDLKGLIPLVSLVVLLCLLFSFRNLEGTLLPLITVIISSVWTVGLMALTGVHFTVVSSCLPVVLIAVGSAYGIHVLNHYYEELRSEEGTLTPQRHRQLIRSSMKKIRGPVILAGVTTIAGFISTITSPIIPLKTFAIFSAVGVAIALLLSLFFIPALLSVKPLKGTNRRLARSKARKETKQDGTTTQSNGSGAAKAFYTFLSSRQINLILFFIIVVALSIWGITRLNVESAIINYFPASSPIRTDVQAIDKDFAGTNSFSFAITGQQPGDLADPAILQAMDDLSEHLTSTYPEIGKIISFSDFIKRMNKVMHAEPEEATEPEASMQDTIEPDSFFGDEGEMTNDSVDGFFAENEDSATSDDLDSFFDTDETEIPEEVVTVEDNDSSDMLAETPDVQTMMALFNRVYAQAGGTGITVDQFLESLEKELNYKGEAYNEVPSDPSKYPVADREGLKNLVSQYLLLYSGSLDKFSNDALQPSEARMQIQLTTHETEIVDAIIKDAQSYAQAHFPEGYMLRAYGIAELENSLTSMITQSQITSLILAIAIVFIILTVYFHSPFAGLIGAIPLVLSILINFGIMGLSGINLDMVTSLIGSIAIGIGVDYTIHFMSDYHYQRLKSDDLDQVTLNTLSVSGKAIVVNAVSVGLGFLVLCLSRFVVLRYIGLLVAIVMLTSSVTAMTVLPALLNIFHPKFISRPVRIGRKRNGVSQGK